MGLLYRLGNATIRVFGNDHLPPHFHVLSPDAEALIEIATLEVIAGTLPRGKVGRQIIEWAAAHKPEIIAEWNRINPRFPTA
jgi:hypothetical protein